MLASSRIARPVAGVFKKAAIARPTYLASSVQLTQPRIQTRAMASSGPQEVMTAQEAAALMEAGYTYVDVRGVDEFSAGHVPKSINIPLGPTLPAAFKERFPNTDTKIVVGCLSGKRAGMAVDALQGAYSNVAIFRGSFNAWASSGMPVEK